VSIYPEFSNELLKCLKTNNNFLIVGHTHPDGDCIYSGLALAELLKSLNKDNKVTLASLGPFNKTEIKGQKDKFVSTLSDEYLSTKPLVCIVDCSELSRVDSVLPKENFEKLNYIILDHHGSSSCKGPLFYISPESISTTLVIQKLSETLNLVQTKVFAQSVLRGFITDSGCFRFLRSSQNETFPMLERIISPFHLSISNEYEYLFFGKNLQSIKFLTTLINRSQTFCDGQLLISENTKEDDETFEGISLPADEFYSQTLPLEKIRVIVLLKYKGDNLTNLGFRSTHSSNIDVAKIACNLPNRANEGGGHMHASGVNLNLNLEEAKKTVISYISKIL